MAKISIPYAFAGDLVAQMTWLDANFNAVVNGASTADFTIAETTDAAIAGAGPLLAISADAFPTLKWYFVSMTGGTRAWLWPPGLAVPNQPTTGIPPSFAVYGDVILGDIATFSPGTNAWGCGQRSALNLGWATAQTQIFSAKNLAGSDVDGGACLLLGASDNAAGAAANDGIAELQANGLGQGVLANAVVLSNRSASNAVTRRWTMGAYGSEDSSNSGTFAPYLGNTYTIGTTTVGVKELYLGAGTGTGIGKTPRFMARDAAGGAGSPANLLENTLKSYTVPANTLAANGDTLFFRAAFRCASNADTKRIRIYFGATSLIDSTAIAMNNNIAIVEGSISMTGPTSQVCYCSAAVDVNALTAWSASLMGAMQFSTPAETLSGAVLLKATVQLGTGTLNDVIHDSLHVWYVPA
jgi:hypothetical protein